MDKLTSLFNDYIEDIYVATPKILIGVATFILFIILAILIKRTTKKIFDKKLEDKLLSIFISKFIYWIFIVIGVVITLNVLGFGNVAGGILAGAGIGAFVIGYAFRDIGENFLAGIMLAFSRPFMVGDTIETNDVIGKVIALDLRNVHLKSFDGKDIFIPNGSLVKNNLVNHTIDGFMRYSINIGLAYEENITSTLTLIRDTLPNLKNVLQEKGKEPTVVINDLANSSLTLTIHYWINTFDKNMSSSKAKEEVTITILEKLNDEQINLPGDVVELKSYNNSSLTINQQEA